MSITTAPTASSAETARTVLDSAFPQGLGAFMDGKVVPGSGSTITLTSAATGRSFAEYADPGTEGANAILESSVRGAATWGKLNGFERAAILRNVSRVVEAHTEELAILESSTTGKPIRDARVEAAKVAEMFGYYAGWADKLTGQTIPVPGPWHTYTERVPWGVVVAITPWNAPLFTAGWNSAAPLAAGNAVIIKPSEFTPATTVRLAQLAHDAGLPDGAFNVATGLGQTVGATLTTDRRVGKISFIGSVPTGRRVAVAAAGAGIPALLELGGKSANIVFADADLERAADGAISAIFSGAGQSCVAGSRLLVERSVHARFIELVADRAARLRVGDPLDSTTEVGPIITAPQFATVTSLIETGMNDGGRRVTGATLPEALRSSGLAGGHWVMPTLLDGVTPANRLETTEVFGPVVGADAFDTEAEAIARANNTNFGLAGAVWTSDISRAHHIAREVKAGTFWINSYKTIHVAVPFGGFGDSGHGRSSGPGVLDEYTQTKAVWVPTRAAGSPFPSLSY
ncbi:aldehyde dehydrogenase [Paenarthrobacter sp. A20]|uniref:aldehyde dehydrogenase family protein n=1 Tax=Paenarthrobacter sp. A20 TaxID=2817891 RepID=UPI0020A09F99|nr:aldehyde dehydrogenase family protein [Paenarthrobacter sp. A20]MCP1413975.1 acyl-CoA reductase-like NAD-dependent aldehyde dehydrogenase [Paenarthrobacter sp. A20]